MSHPIVRVATQHDAAAVGLDLVAVGVVPHGSGGDPVGGECGRRGACSEEEGAEHRHDDRVAARKEFQLL